MKNGAKCKDCGHPVGAPHACDCQYVNLWVLALRAPRPAAKATMAQKKALHGTVRMCRGIKHDRYTKPYPRFNER